MDDRDTIRKKEPHPYLAGNFAPIQKTHPLTPCNYTGTIPTELFGGEYVRNGANPAGTNQDETRQAHWFDGDGMLTGVLFQRTSEGDRAGVQPHFVNQYVLTDVYLAAQESSTPLKHPIPPSIAVLINPLATVLLITWHILRTAILVFLSHLPGSGFAIKRISVANTAILYHDGRALVTCESGPPMRVMLPGLETAGWFDGRKAEGEAVDVNMDLEEPIGGEGLMSFFKEWTTAHPRVDPVTQELILYNSTTMPPYVQYSVLPSQSDAKSQFGTKVMNIAVPGIDSPKMMHDFGVSSKHTVIMDLPLSLNPVNLAKLKPVVAYDPSSPSRFGVFPRRQPERIRWFETAACCIFHTANTWDDVRVAKDGSQAVTAVNMLACRLTSAALVFNAGNLDVPTPVTAAGVPVEEEQSRLYYYSFDLSQDNKNTIRHQWALSSISCEFPTLRSDIAMSAAQYVYVCSSTADSFGMALGRAVKVNALAKFDVTALIAKGKKHPPVAVTGSVDDRTVKEIMASKNKNDPIKVFAFPEGCFAQECRFVPRVPSASEDDGWVLTYVFDEKTGLDEVGRCKPDARSELWIIDAKDMATVVAKIALPQRVPYGLHGCWFGEEEIKGQRDVQKLRSLEAETMQSKGNILVNKVRNTVEGWIA